MLRRPLGILFASLAVFSLIAGGVLVVLAPHPAADQLAASGSVPPTTSSTAGAASTDVDLGATGESDAEAGSGSGGETAGDPDPAGEPIVGAIDPALVAELDEPDAPDAIDAVFFVGPEAAASETFQEYAAEQGLEQASEGWYSGDLTAAGAAALAELPDLRVARNEAFQLDPITPAQSDSVDLWDTAVTVPQVEPTLAAARTSTGKQGTGQVIAIIDSGIDTATPGIGTSKVVKRVDFTSKDWSGCTGSAKDPYGHGTMVASVTAGAKSDKVPGVIGVAPSAKLVDLRVFDCEGFADSFAVGDALTWVRNNHAAYGITVVNLSLGSETPDTTAGTDSMAILVNQLVAQGLVVVVAAGNLGDDASTVATPGSARFATTVGAAFVNKYGSGVSPYSSFGPVGSRAGIDLVAAGTSLKVAKSTALKSFPSPTVVASGTSFASPYVAGLAALLRQQNPGVKPSGTTCTVDGSTCTEGVVLASMTNPIQDLMVTSDWFGAGADATSGAGLVSATASLLHQTVPAATSATATLAANSPSWIKLPARTKATNLSIVLDDNIDILAGDAIDFRWYDAAGSNAGISEPCWLSAAGYSSSCSTVGASIWTQRVWNLVAPASATPVWLRVETNVARTASISVAGLTEPLTATSGIRIDDLQLVGAGTGTLKIQRTTTSATPTSITLGPTSGLLLNGVASPTVTLAAASGSVVNVAVSTAPDAAFGGVSATRIVATANGGPVGLASVQLPTPGATSGLVIADGKQARGMGLNQGADFRITSNGTIAGESYLDYLLRGESSTPGFYPVGLYTVDPGSLAAEPVEIDQDFVTALTFDGISDDGNRVLFRQFPAGSGIVPGDTDDRENFIVYDRTTEQSWEIGTPSVEVNSWGGGGLPVISADGHAVAFGQKLSESQIKIWWWGGTNFTDRHALATVTIPQYTDVQIVGVTDSLVMYQYWSASKQAWQLKIHKLTGSSKTITGNMSLRPVMNPDGSAVIVPSQGSSKVACYRVASGTTRTFDGGTYATGWQNGVGHDCSSIVGAFDRKSGAFGDGGSKLYKITSGGTKTLLAESRTPNHRWVISPDGSQIATSTGDALVPGDTNGIVDIYRGAWTSTTPAGPVPTITGDPKVGATLTANVGAWEPVFTAISYRWKRDGASISGATASTYKLTSSDAGKKITLTVTGTNKGATASQTSSALTIEKIITPGTPKISGTTEVGKTLTASAGTWGPSPITKTYQWKRNGADIPLATGSSYVVQSADAAAAITVSVTGSRAGYTSVTKTSAAVTIKLELTAHPAPTIDGIGRSGTTVTANVTPWQPATVALSYRWYRNGSAITDATAASYKLTSSDAGKSITVTVTGKKTGYGTLSETSAPLAVERLFSATPTPTISGSANAGQTLTAKPGTWSPVATLSYQWKRDGADILDADDATYTLAAADAGHKITVSVRAELDGYTPTTKTSASRTIAKVFTTAPVPTIGGDAAIGATLTATRGTWSPSTDVTYTYRWLRDGVAISGATGLTYKVVDADADTFLTFAVTAKKSGYTTTTVVSEPISLHLP